MKKISKTLILLSLVVAGCGAWANELSPACGDDTVRYTVSTRAKAPLPNPTAGQAQLVVITSVRELCLDCTDVTTRAAIDGSWVGANAGNGYFIVGIAPGAHRLCADWQRPVVSWSEIRTFRADPGHTYYFLVRVSRRSERPENEKFTLQQIPETKARQFLADAMMSVPVVYH